MITGEDDDEGTGHENPDREPPPYVPAALPEVPTPPWGPNTTPEPTRPPLRAILIRAALAGLPALVVAALGTVGAGLAIGLAVPQTCTGDSCFGSPALFGGLFVSPVMIYLGWAVALLALRVRRPWLVALAGAPLTAMFLVATSAYALGSSGVGGSAVQVGAAVLGLLLAGPGAGVGAAVTVQGKGWLSVAVLPAVGVALVLAGVFVSQVVIPLQQAMTVTRYVPHPYRLEDPILRLEVASLNPYNGEFSLQYFANEGADGLAQLNEYRPPSGDLRAIAAAPCAPEAAGTQGMCVRVPTEAPNLAIWRSADYGAAFVVLREDCLIVVTSGGEVNDGTARSMANRLRPDSASAILRSARTISVSDYVYGP